MSYIKRSILAFLSTFFYFFATSFADNAIRPLKFEEFENQYICQIIAEIVQTKK